MNHQVETIAANYYQSGYLYNSRLLRFCWLRDRFLISRFTINQKKSLRELINLAKRAFPIRHVNPC
jgi:hypothetical protein